MIYCVCLCVCVCVCVYTQCFVPSSFYVTVFIYSFSLTCVYARTHTHSLLFLPSRRIQDRPLFAGETLNITVTNNFNSQEFEGTKSIVFTSTSWLGGDAYFLAVSTTTIGALCTFLAGLFWFKTRGE
jgi:LEM3 (ligand-effect modulator 3) family / CDC50 family